MSEENPGGDKTGEGALYAYIQVPPRGVAAALLDLDDEELEAMTTQAQLIVAYLRHRGQANVATAASSADDHTSSDEEIPAAAAAAAADHGLRRLTFDLLQ